MRRWFVLIILPVLLLTPLCVQAQGEVQFDSVLVQLWPEFDKPEMLVMEELTLAPGVTLPLDLNFRVPASATIHVVAVGQTQDSVTDQSIVYETSQEGEWMVLTIKGVSGAAVRIEYYDRLEILDAARHYTYLWPGDASTAALTVIFQQPVDATDLRINPAPISDSTDANGLEYFQIDFPALSVGETAKLEADYQKTTARLSASLPEVQPVAPLGNEAQGRISFASYLPWLVGVAGFLLIIVGLGIGLSYWRGRGSDNTQRRRRTTNRAKKVSGTVTLNCPVCGHRLQPEDHFCRACGTRLGPED